jgi:hypothetical protein
MTAGGCPSASSTLPDRSPWMSCPGRGIGRRALSSQARSEPAGISGSDASPPSDAIGARPVMQARIEQARGSRHGHQRGVQPLAGVDDLGPARCVSAVEVWPPRPAVHDERPASGAKRRRDPHIVTCDLRQHPRLPLQLWHGHVQWLEHDLAHTPRRDSAASQPRGLALGAERAQYGFRRRGHVHSQHSTSGRGRSASRSVGLLPIDGFEDVGKL